MAIELAIQTLLGLLKDGIQSNEVPAIIAVLLILYILHGRDNGSS